MDKTLPYVPMPEVPSKQVDHKTLPQPPMYDQLEHDVHRTHRAAPPSPIVTGAKKAPEPPVKTYHLSNDEESSPDSPVFRVPARVSSVTGQDDNYAFLSVLSKAFVIKIRALEHVRELFCAYEYPESFTGNEAVVSSLDFFVKCAIQHRYPMI
jgi:hypothetical protein